MTVILSRLGRVSLPPVLISIFLLILIELLIFNPPAGLLAAGLSGLLFAVLLNPFAVYLCLISTFALDGFSLIPGISYIRFIAVILALGLALRLTIRREKFPEDASYKYFFLFFLGSLVSFAFAEYLSISIQMYITYISLFFLYVITRYFLQNAGNFEKVINYLLFSALLTTALLHILGISLRETESSRMGSGIGDPNAFASHILVLIPLAFYMAINAPPRRKILYLLCLVLFFLLVILTASRGGTLGLLGMVAVFVFHYTFRRTRYILIFLLIIVFGALFFASEEFWSRVATITDLSVKDSSIHTRKASLLAALKVFWENPVAGIGIYNFQFKGIHYGSLRQMVVHNTYLEILTGGGLLSFVPFLLVLMKSWGNLRLKVRQTRRQQDLLICLKASLVSILITSFFISGDHKKILWFLLAVIASAYYPIKRSSRDSESLN